MTTFYAPASSNGDAARLTISWMMDIQRFPGPGQTDVRSSSSRDCVSDNCVSNISNKRLKSNNSNNLRRILLSRCTSPQLRILINAALTVMKDALSRPLMQEVHLFWTQLVNGVSKLSLKDAEDWIKSYPNMTLDHLSAAGTEKSGQRKGKVMSDHIHTWDEILELVAHLTPFMTNEEHGYASNLAALMILGYLAPTSTPCRLFSDANDEDDSWSKLWDIDLLECIENSSEVYNRRGSSVCEGLRESMIPQQRKAFESLLSKGLGPFLNHHPSHPTQTSLLKLCCMVLAPNARHATAHGICGSTPNVISPTSPTIDSGGTISTFFGLLDVSNYDRYALVQTLSENLNLSQYNLSSEESHKVIVSQLYNCFHDFWREGSHPFSVAVLSLKLMNLIVLQTGFCLEMHFEWLVQILSSSSSPSPSTPKSVPTAAPSNTSTISGRMMESEQDAALLQIYHSKQQQDCCSCARSVMAGLKPKSNRCIYSKLSNMLQILLGRFLGDALLPPNLSKSSSSLEHLAETKDPGAGNSDNVSEPTENALPVDLEVLETGKMLHGVVQKLILEAQQLPLTHDGLADVSALDVTACRLQAFLPCFVPIARRLVAVLSRPITDADSSKQEQRRKFNRSGSRRRMDIDDRTESLSRSNTSEEDDDDDQEHLLRTQCKELEIKLWHTLLALMGFPSKRVIATTCQIMAQFLCHVKSLRFDSNYRSVLQAVRALCLDALQHTKNSNEGNLPRREDDNESDEERGRSGSNQTKISFDELVQGMQPLLSVAAASSFKFAKSVCNFVFALLEEQHPPSQQDQIPPLSSCSKQACLRLLAMVAPSQPLVMRRCLTQNGGSNWIILESLFLQRGKDENDADRKHSELSFKARLHFLFVIVACASLETCSSTLDGQSSNDQDMESTFFSNKALGIVQQTITNNRDGLNDTHRYDPWGLYLVARKAMEMGGWGSLEVASSLCSTIPRVLALKRQNTDCVTSSTDSWFDALKCICTAEGAICREGLMGCPEAVAALGRAQSNLLYVSPDKSKSPTPFTTHWSFSFQQHFLQLRVEMLELCVKCRCLCQEMLYIGINPTLLEERTRSYLHQHTIPMCFFALAKRYKQLFLRHGPFMDAQSRTVLRTLSARSEFLAKAAGKCFVEAAYSHDALCQEWVKGDHLSGAVKLIQNLNKNLIDQISDTVEAPIRAKILSTVLDSVLRMATPYPRYFFQAQPLPLMKDLKLSADPRDVKMPEGWKKLVLGPEELGWSKENGFDVSRDGEAAEILDASNGLACSLKLSGRLPQRYLQTLSIVAVSATYEIKYDGNLDEGDDGYNNSIANEDTMDSSATATSPDYFGVPSRHTQKYRFETSEISPQGEFQINIDCVPPEGEGYYQVEVNPLTVTDSMGDEWTLALPSGSMANIVYLCVGQGIMGNENESVGSH